MGLVFVTIFAQNNSLTFAKSNKVQSNTYSITTPYEYPVKPGTDAWKNFKTHADKMDACQIPEGILKNITTKALVETVMNYPLMIDMLAMPSRSEGYQDIYNIFNGLRELANRSDASIELSKYKENLSKSNTLISTSSKDILKPLYTDVLIDGLNTSKSIATNGTVVPYATTVILKTPNGSNVYADYDRTWSDTTSTPESLAVAQQQMSQTYPAATLLSGYNIKYNCHSYAWNSTSTTNKYWINDPSPYMTDGSYTSTAAATGTKVFYDSAYGTRYDHSGIVVGVNPYGGGVQVESKWGELGVYNHNIFDCPYAGYSPTCTFWKR